MRRQLVSMATVVGVLWATTGAAGADEGIKQDLYTEAASASVDAEAGSASTGVVVEHLGEPEDTEDTGAAASPYVACGSIDYRDPVAVDELFAQVRAHRDEIQAAGGFESSVQCARRDGADDDVYLTGLDRPGPPAAEVLALSASSQIEVATPVVATSPPRSGVQLVGIDVWFWAVGAQPASATASVTGLASTVVATPVSTTVVLADGTELRCPGGGLPWEAAAEAHAEDACRHVFQDAGIETIAVTVEWQVVWTATNGQAGTLPSIERTTTFDLDLHGAYAVTD